MYSIYCLLEGLGSPFPVDIDKTRTVGHLKQEIKKEKAVALAGVDADNLNLYHVTIPSTNQQVYTEEANKIFKDLSNHTPLNPSDTLSAIEGGFPERTLHILIHLPQSESIDSRACSAVTETMR
jgi:hypothetical protein